MILKLRLGNHRITFTFAKVIDVLGVNSKLTDGNHILMWDFDALPLKKVIRNLATVQTFFKLPKIYILRSSPPDNYIAYCFSRNTWAETRAIVGMTEGIDENFYKWGVFRKRFTLRVGAKTGYVPTCVNIIFSPHPEEANVAELKSWVKYETLNGHHDQRVHFLEVP